MVLNKSIIKKQILQWISNAWWLISVFNILNIIRKRNPVSSSIWWKKQLLNCPMCGTGAWLSPPSPPLLAAPSRLGSPAAPIPGNALCKMNNAVLCFSEDPCHPLTCQSANGYSVRTAASMPTMGEQRWFWNLPTVPCRETSGSYRRGNWLFLEHLCTQFWWGCLGVSKVSL